MFCQIYVVKLNTWTHNKWTKLRESQQMGNIYQSEKEADKFWMK
jgi:hypothetical protein